MNPSVRVWMCTGILLLSSPFANAAAARFSAQEVQRGDYLAHAGDCLACHTDPGGKPYAGGLPMHLPMDMGTLYTPNITPDRQYGIGNYSLRDFDRAVRQGITPAGKHLYPAMPYPSYALINNADMRALYAYFMQGVAPVSQPNRKNAIPWALSARWPLAVWNYLFVKDKPFQPNPQRSTQWNRGAYLVESLGHCGACHTPRGWFSQLKTMNPGGSDGRYYLSGSLIDNWYADNLRSDRQGGLGRWTTQDIVEVLQRGRTAKYTVSGSMADVIHNSTQHLSEADLLAIATFLKSLSPAFPAAGQAAPPAPAVAKAGKALYQQYCSTCHQGNGQGLKNLFPALALNSTVESRNPRNTIRMMLNGGHTARTSAFPTALPMPRFGAALTDQQIADIASYVRSSWGNHASAVSSEAVQQVRKEVGK